MGLILISLAGPVFPLTLYQTEYLPRGSCGISIDRNLRVLAGVFAAAMRAGRATPPGMIPIGERVAVTAVIAGTDHVDPPAARRYANAPGAPSPLWSNSAPSIGAVRLTVSPGTK